MDNTTNEVNIAGVDLRRLLGDGLRILRHTFMLFLALCVLLVGLLYWREYRSYQPMYRASATFTVYVSNPLQVEVRGYNVSTAEQMAKTFPYILTSGVLSDRVMRELGISSMPAASASVMNNTNIFTLSVTSPDPQLAYDVLNSLIRNYPEVAEFVVGPTIMNLLDESGVPEWPYNSRSYSQSIKKGVLFSAAIWLAAAFALASLRTTIHTEEELRSALNLRTISILPVVRERKRGSGCPRYDQGSVNSGFTESVRLMRLRVEKEMDEQHMKVLIVSSATPSEGKTTVAINLACAMADKGKTVLLVDCDLRNPSVAKGLRQENGTGLAEYLCGEVSYRDIIRPDEKENLYVVFAGEPSGEASELLARPECKQFIDACRNTFDYVILDTPPAAMLADASELSVLADGVLLTIRQNYASRRHIQEGAQILSDSGLPIIGCVMNYAPSRRGSSGYYGYGYGYGHYGYGTYGETSKE